VFLTDLPPHCLDYCCTMELPILVEIIGIIVLDALLRECDGKLLQMLVECAWLKLLSLVLSGCAMQFLTTSTKHQTIVEHLVLVRVLVSSHNRVKALVDHSPFHGVI